MRLYLHGRSTSSMLLKRIERAHTQQISSILLSGWEVHGDELVLQELIRFFHEQRHRQCELAEVVLQNCQGNLQGLVAAILGASPKLFILRFDKQQNELSDFISLGLVQGAPQSCLRQFAMHGVSLTLSSLQAMRSSLPQLPYLESLSFKCQFTIEEHSNIFGGTDPDQLMGEMVQLVGALPRLRNLDLEGCHISDHHLSELIVAASQCPLLSHLNLRGNVAQLGTFRVLSEWLSQTNCSLSHLDLSWQRRPGSTNVVSTLLHLSRLLKSLQFNTSLQTLILSENKIRNQDIELLFRALQSNTTLKHLELRDCYIAMEGFKCIAYYLPCLRLQSLVLNGAQQAGGKTLKNILFAPLSQNVYLLDLTLPHVESRSLAWVLELNKAGRQVMFQDPPLPPALWPHLLAHADRVGQNSSSRQPVRHSATSIYYLLREKGFEVIANYTESRSQVDNESTPKIATRGSFQENEHEQNCHKIPNKTIQSVSTLSGDVEVHLYEHSSLQVSKGSGMPMKKPNSVSWGARDQSPRNTLVSLKRNPLVSLNA